MADVPPDLAWSHWSSAGHPSRRQFAAWTEALWSTHLEWSLHRPRDARYRAELERYAVDVARIVRCRCDPLEGSRARGEISRSEGAFFGVVLVVDGAETIRSAAGEARLARGSFALWDSERDLEFRVSEPLQKISLLVPKDRFRAIVAEPERDLGHVVDAGSGAGALAAHQLLALARHAGQLGEQAGGRVLDGTLELVGAALRAAAPPCSQRATQLLRVREWIERHLEDPDLTPERIAAAHGIAVRTLHAWFHAEGVSLSRWMLRRRLERAMRDLSHGDGVRVTEVALRWGFNDFSYFSRTFKRMFGKRPRDVARSGSARSATARGRSRSGSA
ncbi:Transcriptional regulator, AraC family protein [Minicystis rosea]|nr:Transcriptional regulator, AraC family protein [Minicystis rosea]